MPGVPSSVNVDDDCDSDVRQVALQFISSWNAMFSIGPRDSSLVRDDLHLVLVDDEQGGGENTSFVRRMEDSATGSVNVASVSDEYWRCIKGLVDKSSGDMVRKPFTNFPQWRTIQ